MFEDKITITDAVKVYVYGQELTLVYRIRYYKKVPDQGKEYLSMLKKQNVKLRLCKKRINGTVVKCFYYLDDIFLETKENKFKIIEDILKTKHPEYKHTLLDEITIKRNNKVFNKDTLLTDRDSNILSILGTYFLGGLEADNMLDEKRWEQIKKYEVASFSENYTKDSKIDKEYNKYFVKNISTTDSMNNFNKAFKFQVQRWNTSKTYRLNKVYSFDNHSSDVIDWIWFKNNWQTPNEKYNWKRKGLINSEIHYVSTWCLVDTENSFIFNENRYSISDKVKEYLGESIKKTSEILYEMDKILVIKQNDNVYYFNQDIKQIKNKFIQLINNK